MVEPSDWPPKLGQAVRVVYGRSRNRMTGEVVGIEEHGSDALYLVMMTMPTGEPRPHLPDPIRCRLSDLEPVQAVHEDETPPGL